MEESMIRLGPQIKVGAEWLPTTKVLEQVKS